jgi:hypothetical protein
LEDRATPATITWINPAGGAWDNAANWDLARTPQPDDDVIIRDLNFGAVVDHANGADTVQSISSPSGGGILAITHSSSLSVTADISVPTLEALTGGVVTANNEGSLRINLRAESGGEIHLPTVSEYHGTIFTSIVATGAGSLVDLPELASLMATTGPAQRGEVRLDLIADQGGTINLPALSSVRGHPPDYIVGYTALRASNGGTFLLDTNSSVIFAANGSLNVDPGADFQAGDIAEEVDGDLTVDGTLEATSVFAQGNVTITGTLTISGSYTNSNGSTFIDGGTLAVSGLLDNEGALYAYGAGGTISGDVYNGGLLSVTYLLIDGNYTQAASGQLTLQLRATDFDQLVITGFATLDGTLNAPLMGGYQPQPGDELQVIQFGAGTGAFAHVQTGAPLFGVLYTYLPRDGVQPGVTLLF